ncbi:protein NLRC5-like [Patiria miniata]|uniref:Uncharacterized protein n=1 Tax=Patiria miniata TaxID=46514 RepID=A0A913ZP31_PATMI|nr:protein NLRC5-like [Patiria miniata]
MEHIIGELSKLPNLVDLDLSNNDTLAGSDRAWSLLREIKTLNKLDLGYCRLRSDDVERIAVGLSYLPNLVELDLSNNDTLAGCDRAWSHLREIKTLNKLDLGYCRLGSYDVEHITVGLSYLLNLVKLDLSHNETLAGSGRAWSHLREIKTLNKLNLRYCGLKSDDLEPIAIGLSNLPKLVDFDLSHNETLAGSCRAWSHLREIKTLNKLNLRYCELGSDDLEPIAVGLSNLFNLVELDLSDNETLAGSGRSWSHLSQIKTLNKLNLRYCELGSDDLEPIAVVLSYLPNLVQLDLSDCETLAGSCRAWINLKEIKTLNKLNLSSCELKSDDFEHIADGLSDMPNFIELDLSCNETLFGSWSHLRKLKTLNKLDLSNCALGSDDLKPIADGLSYLPKLVELDLSDNKALAGSNQSWSHLRGIKTLSKLNLRGCKLNCFDLEFIAVWLRILPNLDELDLSSNQTLAWSGQAWSHLREIKTLNKLDLKRCGLTSGDLEPIAVWLSNLPNLVELDLSHNETLALSGLSWHHLMKIQTLNKLDLRSCGLKSDDLEHIANGLRFLPNLVELDLHGNETLAVSGRAWSHLGKIETLNKLDLRCCRLQSDDLEYVAVGLSNLPNLVELDLSHNEALAVSGRSWSHLRGIKTLNKLSLGYCGLQSGDLEPFAIGLSDLPKLVELDLSGNSTLAGSDRSWYHLREIKTLNKLDLRCCRLQSDDLEYIAVGLSNLSNLVELDMSCNETLAGSGWAWSHLREIKTLKKLNLGYCGLQSGDLEPFAIGLSDLPKLVELDLSGNQTLDWSGRAWSHWREIKTLNKLNLRSCGLKNDDLEHVAVGLSNLPNLVELDMSCNETLAGSGWAWSHLRESKTLNKLNLGYCGLQSGDLEPFANGLSDLPKLVELDLSGNNTLAGSDRSWYHLREIKTLNKLDLRSCGLKSDDLEHIAVGLSNLPNLVELDLSCNETLAGSGWAWSHLRKIKTLNKLNLGYCGLQSGDIEPFANGLSDLPKLVELDLSGNSTLAGSDRSWYHLRKIKTLNKLDLRNCGLKSDDLEHIAGGLSNLPNLELDLSCNETLAGSGWAWSHLREIKTINKLNLGFCKLGSDDLKPIAVGLSDLPKLVELDLSGNSTLAGSGWAWSHLRENKTLKKLNLGYCGLQSGDLEPFAIGLSDLPKLVELDLSGNRTLDWSGRAWSHLREIKTLNKLNLRSCGLKSDDLEHIAVGLSNLPKLVELDLSGNSTLAGSDWAWSHLRDIKTLNKLNLGCCKLESDDLKHIAVGLSDLPRLVELDLSCNETLAGSGRSWFHLGEIESLNKLYLRSCKLESVDLEHVALLGLIGHGIT